MKLGARSSSFLTLVCCLAALTVAVHSSGARAQAGKAEDLKAVYATPADIAEGKRLARTACAQCHGLDGVSTAKGVPHIAGQRPGYMLVELRAYQKGVRKETPMNASVKFLSDDALVKVTAYYASLDPAPPSPPSGGKASAIMDPVQAGKVLAADCGGCHGDAGVSTTPGMPSLVGFDTKYFVGTLKAYKSGQRKNDIMKSLVSGMSEADMENLALYYGLIKPPTKKEAPLNASQSAGKAAAAACEGCHGPGGVSPSPANPSIAGQEPNYFVTVMQAYKAGTRPDETMKGVAAGLDDKTIKDLAAYYAVQEAKRAKVAKPLTVSEWAQRCDRCHGINGNSADPMVSAIAGQRADYLEEVLHAYRTKARTSPAMAAMAASLSAGDVAKISVHYAQQKPRAFVFMPVPAK